MLASVAPGLQVHGTLYRVSATAIAARGLTLLQGRRLGSLIVWAPDALGYGLTGLTLAASWLHRARAQGLMRIALLRCTSHPQRRTIRERLRPAQRGRCTETAPPWDIAILSARQRSIF
jgi:hypothetical protein